MGSKNNPGKYDCYANAEPDEPMFILLGRDIDAPALVWLWATMRKLRGADPEKVSEAEQCAAKMVEWADSKGKTASGIGIAMLAAVLEMMEDSRADAPIEDSKKAMELIRRVLFKAKPEVKPAALDTEMKQFVAMLSRAWIGHGLRHDHNPPGTGVQVESDSDAKSHLGAEFWFDEAGVLKKVSISDTVGCG